MDGSKGLHLDLQSGNGFSSIFKAFLMCFALNGCFKKLIFLVG